MRVLAVVVTLAACGGSGGGGEPASEPSSGSGSAIATPNPSCPALKPAPSPLPGVTPAHRTLAYWLEHTPDVDAPLLDVAQIQNMNASLAVDRGGDWHGEFDLTAPVDPARLAKDIGERLAAMQPKLKTGDFVDKDGGAIKPADLAEFDPARATAMTPAPELRVALEAVPLRCGPRVVGFYSKPAAGAALDTRFDRNSCSTAHPQEVVQVLAEWPNGMRLARTRYATGWISKEAKLSPAIPAPLREAFVHGPRAQADEDLASQVAGGGAQCPAGTLLPLVTNRVHYANASGFHDAPATNVQPTRRPLTKRALLGEAFRFLDSPYGWGGGGTAGGHDCSSFMLDLFAAFDIHLPRHSNWQARAGSFSIDISKVTAADERLRLIDAAAKKGVVLLSFPGHVMLYLGRNESGAPMIMHAIAEYVTPCPTGGETINQIDRVTVSDLDLGKGSSRRSLLERLAYVTVIGKAPGAELAGAAELRPAALVARPDPKKCKDSSDIAIFASPRHPNAKEPVRIIATANADPGAVELALFDPSGARATPGTLVKLPGGPPWSVIATLDKPAVGTWTAVLGDGARIDACLRIAVRPTRAATSTKGDPQAPAWDVERGWTRATENLYATFVQRLFDFPPDQDVTWPDLHTLLRDPAHNILFDHRGLDEDLKLKLKPDCADLPFLLRSYFAWKMGLPFGYHACTRGNATRAPICKKTFNTNLMIRDWLDDNVHELDMKEELAANDPGGEPGEPVEPLEIEEADGIEETKVEDVNAFAMFWGRHVSNTVHASTGRTLPKDDNTDYYPIPLARESLRPGAIYNDPFGHVMVVVEWVSQTATSYGVLLAADAQPDGTVGRKRFWRGNFLFTTDTKVAGAGFKAFRPAIYKSATKTIEMMKNADLERSRTFTPFSQQQYEGTVDTFHDTMEALINPRPLDPFVSLTVLVDALHSQAKLRVISVKNGEDWAAAHPGVTMAMPDGAAIFLAAGPWEDFATPSRDFRLLVAIDTVMSFPASVKRNPGRFAVKPADVDATLARLDKELDAALQARAIEYVRSDGKTQKVTLKELVDRRAGFEVSYNPNDCAEIRWAAPEGSPERASCTRHAPPDQQAKLADYRAWFRDRKRPAR